MRARLLVIQHEDDAPAAWFGDWLEAAGIELAVVHGHRGETIPDSLGGFDGLLVLGGAMAAYDDDSCPWLTPTKRLIAATLHLPDKAFLGICLGHQLAAVALGGTVARNPTGRALGLTPVCLTDEGRLDPLVGGVGGGARAVQWNDDVVTVMPEGTDGGWAGRTNVLAVAPDGTIQAARFGPASWGVQFHPEVSPEVFAGWGAGGEKADPPGPAGPAAGEVAMAAERIAEASDELRRTWRPLAEGFADIVAAPT